MAYKHNFVVSDYKIEGRIFFLIFFFFSRVVNEHNTNEDN